jgi:hypothetical protein
MTQELGITHLLKLHCSKRLEADHVESPTIDDPEALRDVTISRSPEMISDKIPSAAKVETRS